VEINAEKRVHLLENINGSLPENFVYLTDIVPDVILEMRYYSSYNFVGVPIDQYHAPVAIINKPAAQAMAEVSKKLIKRGYIIKVWDAYRPQGAVNHFVRWAADMNDVLSKKVFYPDVCKNRLLVDGFIAKNSGHSRGSAIDLTLVDMLTGKELDMGSAFDFFGDISGHGTDMITEEQAQNRLILKNAMEDGGFLPYSKEWWHYTLADEPYPDTYFDFPVK